MEFKVTKSDILKELSLMQGIIERRTTIPILANFLIQARDDVLSFTSTDLEITLKNSCPAEVKEPGTAALPTKMVYDVVRSLSESDIHITTAETGRIFLRCKTANFKLASLPAEEFPQVKTVQEYPITFAAELLNKVLSNILFAISMEESRFPVTGALFILTQESMLFVSTDGHRLAMVESAERAAGLKGTLRTVVPRKALVELKKILDLGEADDVGFAVDENQAFFQVGRRELVTRLLEAEFPKYEKVIPQNNDKVFVFQKDEIEQAVRHVAAIATDKAQGAKLEFSPGKVSISNTLPELGEAKEEISTSYDGEPFEIGFNIQYLQDFFTHCEDDRIVLKLKDQSVAGVLLPEGDKSYRFQYILMPMKI